MGWKLKLRPSALNAALSSDDAKSAACDATLPSEGEDDRITFHVTQETLEVSALHARYLDDVFAYVARRVARREEAEDITAEVFAAAFEALPRFRHRCHPRLWLLGIARRKIADAMRRSKTRRETLASELSAETSDADTFLNALAPGEPAAACERAEARRAVRALVQALKEEQREALLLKYVEGLSINEIAVVMGRSPGAVNSLLQRARATIFREGQEYFGATEVTP